MKIGKIKIDFPVLLAPRAGFTDYPFRVLCKRMGAGLVYSEFVSADGIIRENIRTLEMIRFSEEEIFGNVISQASSVAQGEWITKMDDDEWYGHEHVSDLILASRYSKADMVGKSSEFVYLTEQNQTIRRDLGNSEGESLTLGGGTLLIRSSLLKETHGWRSLSRGIDVALIEDSALAGGRIWRTHPFGYLLRRTQGQHTWEVDDSYFLKHSYRRWDGKAFDLVGVVGDD